MDNLFFLVNVFVIISIIITIFSVSAFFSRAENARHCKFERPHGFWVVLYALFLLLLIAINFHDFENYFSDGHDEKMSILMIVLFVYYLLVISFCGQYDGASHLKSVSDAEKYAKNIRAAKPVLYFSVECYHFDIETYTTQDSDGKIESHTRIVKEITWFSTHDIPIPFWADYTHTLLIPDVKMVHVKSKGIVQWLPGSEDIINSIHSQLYRSNCQRDLFCCVSDHITIPELLSNHVISHLSPTEIPAVFNFLPRHLLALLGLGLSAALRMASHTPVVHHEVLKRASLDGLVASAEWCLLNHVDYLKVVPHAPVLDVDTVGSMAFPSSPASPVPGTPPSFENPLPLAVRAREGFE